MKLLRVGAPGSEIPAVLMGDGLFLDVSVGGDFTEEFFRSGKLAQLPALVDQLLADGAQPQPLSGQRIGAPIGRPHQIVCIGLNYADHAAETGQDIPRTHHLHQVAQHVGRTQRFHSSSQKLP